MVTLTGKAPNRTIKELADRAAWNEPGVRDVHNNLKIMPSRRERANQSRQNQGYLTTSMGQDNSAVSEAADVNENATFGDAKARETATIR